MEIALYQARWHLVDSARETLDRIQHRGTFLHGVTEMSNVLTLQDNDGRSILLEAIPVAREQKDKPMKTYHLREIGKRLVECGDSATARNVLAEASIAASQIDDAEECVEYLSSIAIEQSAIGDLEGRDCTVEAALPIAWADSATWDSEYGPKQAAEVLWHVDREAESRAILAEVALRIASLSDLETREKANAALACRQASIGDIVSAGQTLERIVSLDQRVFVLLTVAQSQLEASDTERCRKTIDIALRTLAACEDMGFKLILLLEVAKLQAGREANDADNNY